MDKEEILQAQANEDVFVLISDTDLVKRFFISEAKIEKVKGRLVWVVIMDIYDEFGNPDGNTLMVELARFDDTFMLFRDV